MVKLLLPLLTDVSLEDEFEDSAIIRDFSGSFRPELMHIASSWIDGPNSVIKYVKNLEKLSKFEVKMIVTFIFFCPISNK
jgi:hypothetical protein